MFNVDSHFEIGSSHKVCEDFAIHGSFETPGGEILYYGIVTDGCSSSMMQGGIRLPINVDTGARLLALIAKQAIREIIPTLREMDESLSEALRISILRKMDILLRQLELPIAAMDCTLLINMIYKGRYFAVVFGDGVCVFKDENLIIIDVVEFDSGAPYYLSYSLDKDRNELYKEKFGDQQKRIKRIIIQKQEGIEEVGKSEIVEDFDKISTFMNWTSFKNGDPVALSIISDGALSFQQKGEGQYDKRILTSEEIIPKLVALKGTKMDFLGRVMNITHRWMKREKIDHYDDLAIATIAQNPPPKDRENA